MLDPLAADVSGSDGAAIFWSASVQHGITPPSWNWAGSPRSAELSKTVPSRSFPV